MAAEGLCERASAALGEGVRPDLVLVSVSGGHAGRMASVARAVREALGPGALLGVTADGVIGEDVELAEQAGVSLLAASLPGTTITPFTYSAIPHATPDDESGLARLASAIGAGDDARAVVLLADPLSVPAASTVSALSAAAGLAAGRPVPVVGGMASAGMRHGANVLVLDGEAMRAGGVGATVRGDVRVDTLVSQGCRPIGVPMVVTGGRRNIITHLAGRTALEMVREVMMALPDAERQAAPGNLFLGRVINEYKERFGRGDFLIRGLIGVDRDSGAVAVADSVRVGQTVQLHIRDAQTAAEDLELLLHAEQLKTPPAGAWLVTCNGRGPRLFGEANRDALAVSSALSEVEGGGVPLAGFFAAGEIGPVGSESFVHAHTACVTMFRHGAGGSAA